MNPFAMFRRSNEADVPASGSFGSLTRGGAIIAWGTAVPGAVAGYRKGCLFLKIDGAADQQLYMNEGTLTSASFVVIPTP